MINFFHVIYVLLKSWITKHKPKFSLIRYILVLICILLLSWYYVDCYRPAVYYDAYTIGLHNCNIIAENLSYNYDRNHIFLDTSKLEGFILHFKAVNAKKNNTENEDLDSVAKQILNQRNDVLLDKYLYGEFTHVGHRPLLVPSAGLKQFSRDDSKRFQLVQPVHTEKFGKDTDICYSFTFWKDSIIIQDSLDMTYYDANDYSPPSWLLKGDLSKFELCFMPHIDGAEQYPSVIKIEFNDIVKINRLYPLPDSLWLTGFAYTDSTKVAQIFHDGVKGLCNYPSMEGWQLARTFILTTLLTLLLTLLFTMSIDFVRNHKELYKWAHFIMFSIVWLILVYILYVYLLKICCSADVNFYWWMIIETLLMTTISFFIVKKVLIKYDITFIPAIDGRPKLRSVDIILEIFNDFCVVILCCFIQCWYWGYVICYPLNYIDDKNYVFWRLCTWLLIIIGFLLPIVMRYTYNNKLAYKRRKILFIAGLKKCGAWINANRWKFALFFIFLPLIFEIYCCIYTKVISEQLCENIEKIYEYPEYSWYTSERSERIKNKNNELMELYTDFRCKCSMFGDKELKDAIWRCNIEDYIEDNHIEPIIDSSLCKSYGIYKKLSRKKLKDLYLTVGSKYSIISYIQDTILHITRIDNETGVQEFFKKDSVENFWPYSYRNSQDGKYLSVGVYGNYESYVILLLDELIEFKPKGNSLYAHDQISFIDNYRFVRINDDSTFIYDSSEGILTKPLKAYKNIYTRGYSSSHGLIYYCSNEHPRIDCWIDPNNNIIKSPRKFNTNNGIFSHDGKYIVSATNDTLNIFEIRNEEYIESHIIIPSIKNIYSLVFEDYSNRLWILTQNEISRSEYHYALYYVDLDKSYPRRCCKTNETFTRTSKICAPKIKWTYFGLCINLYENNSMYMILPKENPSRPFIFRYEYLDEQCGYRHWRWRDYCNVFPIKALPEITWYEVRDYALKRYENNKQSH